MRRIYSRKGEQGPEIVAGGHADHPGVSLAEDSAADLARLAGGQVPLQTFARFPVKDLITGDPGNPGGQGIANEAFCRARRLSLRNMVCAVQGAIVEQVLGQPAQRPRIEASDFSQMQGNLQRGLQVDDW